MKKVDYKKELKHLYKPSPKSIEIVDVPEMNFLMIDGQGEASKLFLIVFCYAEKEVDMEWSDILTDGYNRVPEYLGSILEGLTPEDLKWQPGRDANSIGWLAWHLTRQHDAQVADLMEDEQLWVRDGWAKKFKRPVDRRDTGFGDTPEQVAAFEPPDNPTVLGYQKAVTERTLGYIRSLSSADLDRELGGPWTPTPTVGVRLVSILEDAVIHAGQAAYVRGLLQGRGWQPY